MTSESTIKTGVRSEDCSGTFGEIESKPDVIIDYSHPDYLADMLDYEIGRAHV